jgi:hypothetical protein
LLLGCLISVVGAQVLVKRFLNEPILAGLVLPHSFQELPDAVAKGIRERTVGG